MLPRTLVVALAATTLAGTAQAGFYLPGVAPKSYEMRENVRVVSLFCLWGGLGCWVCVCGPTWAWCVSAAAAAARAAWAYYDVSMAL